MGLFSWKTSEGRSISTWMSKRGAFTVYMVLPDGRRIREDGYAGYGDFGDLDFYALVHELNSDCGRGKGDRRVGLGIYYDTEKPILPRFTTDPTKTWDELTDPEDCEFQGYFYPEGVGDE